MLLDPVVQVIGLATIEPPRHCTPQNVDPKSHKIKSQEVLLAFDLAPRVGLEPTT